MKDLFETDRVFLPKPDTKVNYEKMCFGEARFFKSKFWKLHVIMGFEYTSLSVIQNGFSFFNINVAKRKEDFLNRLKEMQIEFKTNCSESGYTYRVIISAKKRNLELIDKLYDKFYKEQIESHRGWLRYNTELITKELRNSKDFWYYKYDDEFELVA